MNEVDLIKEVEKRPILYDKSVSGFNKTKLRDEAWKEVQEALDVPESECKKRWRSLRDSFIKLQRTHGGRTRWPYHLAMRFLLPHVDPSAAQKSEECRAPTDDSDSDVAPHVERRGERSLPDLSFAVEQRGCPAEPRPYDDDDAPSPKKLRVSSTEDEACACGRTDPDDLFLLSCSPTLKRLSSKQNAVARLKIQQVLYEAEFGARGPPYPPHCAYDAIE